jgi:predicted transcriptional regulator
VDSTEVNFEDLLKEVQRNRKTVTTYPHIALEHLGVSRRGWRVVEAVNKLLEKYEVICEPDFGSAWFYGKIELKPKPKVASGRSSESGGGDPTPRLSLLRAANLNRVKEAGDDRGLVTVSRDTSTQFAITLMILHDFSQLPILSGPRKVEGIISWKSIGRAISLGKECVTVSDCKDDVMILDHNEPLFTAVKYVLEREVVLVKHKDETICGIVTATDIGEQFIAMAEPFLIIEQIENHIRKMLDQKFSMEELEVSIPHQEKQKDMINLSDLSFGQYVRILEDPKKFEKLKLKIDRSLLTAQLERVRKIRNDVMHFDPEGVTPRDIDLLRQTLLFLQTINSTVAIR